MILGKIIRFIGTYSIVPSLSRFSRHKNFRISIMRTDRLGHLSLNSHLFFIRRKIGALENFNYLLISPSIKSKKVANVSLLLMFLDYSKKTENVRIICSSFLHFFFTFFQVEFRNSQLLFDMTFESKESEFSLGKQTVSFTKKQKSIGNEILLQMNITKNDKLVCVYTRDSSFLENLDNQRGWSYHNYRDTNIKSYLKAIKYLIKEGYTVVRIGSEYSKSLEYINDKYIEYNLSEYKSSFMDLYIPYVSSFIIGCKSGATDVSLVFNIPILITDLTAFMETALGKNDLFIQKKLIDLKGNIVPFKEVIPNEKYYTYDGNKMKSLYGMTYLDNTEDEILDATVEMHNKLNDNFTLDLTQIDLLTRYHNEYCNKNKWSTVSAPISVSWLEKNYDLYLDD